MVKVILACDDHNLRVNSDGWVKRTDPHGQEYLEAPTGDIWEIINCTKHPELNGEQLFTWDAAMREAEAAGKRLPTDEEFDELLRTKADMPNLVLAGYRYTDGSFGLVGSGGYFWSSLESGCNAWRRNLFSSEEGVYRDANGKMHGFSVRCVKN